MQTILSGPGLIIYGTLLYLITLKGRKDTVFLLLHFLYALKLLDDLN